MNGFPIEYNYCSFEHRASRQVSYNHMILATDSAGFIGSNFSSGITRIRALACTEIRAKGFVIREAAL